MIIQSNGATAIVDDQGATLTRFQIGSTDIIFPLQMHMVDGAVKLRGGVPIPFPWFGPWKDHRQHGFLRNMLVQSEGLFDEFQVSYCTHRLKYGKANVAEKGFGYPYNVVPIVFTAVRKNGFSQEIEMVIPDFGQSGDEKAATAPFNTGFHPYFRMPAQKAVVRMGGEEWEVAAGKFELGKHIHIPKPMLEASIIIEGLGTIRLNSFQMLARPGACTLIWTDSFDYLCVEPVFQNPDLLGKPGGLTLGNLNTNNNRGGYTCEVELEN